MQAGDAPYLDHMPIGYQRYRKRSFVEFKNKAEDEAYLRSVDKLIDLMKVLHSEGIQMLPGTDDTTGFTVHRELELYEKAGIPAAAGAAHGHLRLREISGLRAESRAVSPPASWPTSFCCLAIRRRASRPCARSAWS